MKTFIAGLLLVAGSCVAQSLDHVDFNAASDSIQAAKAQFLNLSALYDAALKDNARLVDQLKLQIRAASDLQWKLIAAEKRVAELEAKFGP